MNPVNHCFQRDKSLANGDPCVVSRSGCLATMSRCVYIISRAKKWARVAHHHLLSLNLFLASRGGEMATDNHTDMSINSTNAEFGGLEGGGIGTEGERGGTRIMGGRRKVKEGFLLRLYSLWVEYCYLIFFFLNMRWVLSHNVVLNRGILFVRLVIVYVQGTKAFVCNWISVCNYKCHLSVSCNEYVSLFYWPSNRIIGIAMSLHDVSCVTFHNILNFAYQIFH